MGYYTEQQGQSVHLQQEWDPKGRRLCETLRLYQYGDFSILHLYPDKRFFGTAC
jgi:hypothetical protein